MRQEVTLKKLECFKRAGGSKWKEIEISDDEDDTHPNIDTPSLFRWRHQARMEKMVESQKEKEMLEKEKSVHEMKKQEVEKRISEAKKNGDMTELKKSIEELEKEGKTIQEKAEELKKKERLTPWNVDTISHEGFTKTIINANPHLKKENLTEEEKEEKMRKFVKENESLIKKYGMMQKFEDSKHFLQKHTHLACEETASYLVIWCINLEMTEKHDLMVHVSHQCICMQYILELSKQLDVDPRACISSFFTRIQVADQEYKKAFYNELDAFRERVMKRAKEKLEDAAKEAEEEERKEREQQLGPGGLDPIEVFESLPEDLKKCFEVQDIPMLQKVIASMPEDEARYHMKRCVDSGLWVPDARERVEETKEEDIVEEAVDETADAAV